MKILIIIGSNRKKNCFTFSEKIANELKKINAEINFEYINLNDYKLKFCNGCSICKSKGDCILDDGIKFIKKKIINADGIIISSPVYSHNVSALIKNFLDRFHYYHFRPSFFYKPVIILTITAFTGLKETLKYLQFNFKGWGLNIVGMLGLKTNKYSTSRKYKDKIDNRMKKIAKSYYNNLLIPKINITLLDLIQFQIQKQRIINIKNNYVELYNFWERKGWLNSNYYIKNNKKDVFKIKLSKILYPIYNLIYFK